MFATITVLLLPGKESMVVSGTGRGMRKVKRVKTKRISSIDKTEQKSHFMSA